MPLIWGGYQGDFSLETLDPGDFVLLDSPTPGENSQLCSNHFTIWLARGPTQGQADDMCIKEQTNYPWQISISNIHNYENGNSWDSN